MDLKPIKTKRDYQAALKRVEQLWHAAAGSTEADALDVLTLLIADYETRQFSIADPDPIQFLEYVMESRGLTRKDLEPYLGSRARVAEVLEPQPRAYVGDDSPAFRGTRSAGRRAGTAIRAAPCRLGNSGAASARFSGRSPGRSAAIH